MSDERDPVIRDLIDPRPLDVEAELQRMMFVAAIVRSLCIDTTSPSAMSKDEVWAVLWRRVPFIKALAELGREHRLELRVRWKRALQEPMPFGGEPLGLPEGEEP